MTSDSWDTNTTTRSNTRSPCRVVNRYKEDYDVYIGRGTKWGNPHKDMPRAKAIALYKETFKQWLRDGTITLDDLRELQGMRIACSCKPQPCHGDIIAKAVNLLAGVHVEEHDLRFLGI